MLDAVTLTGDMSKPDIPSAVVKSAGRVLQILEFFDAVQREARVTEISRVLRYPQSSTSVLLRSLVDMGYLQHDRYQRSYFPTRRVSLLGNWVDPALVQQGRLLAQANELASEVRHTVVLATANGLNAQYIYVSRAVPGSTEPAPAGIGQLRPIAATAVGKALLSTLSGDHVSKLIRRINAERSDAEPLVNATELVAELSLGRRHGYFAGAGAGAGQWGMATALPRERQLLAIGIEAPADDIANDGDRLATMLRKFVGDISAERLQMTA